MMRRAASVARAVLISVTLPLAALGQDRFPDALWDPGLLSLLDAGPQLLPPDLDLGIPPPPGPDETRFELDRLELVYAAFRDDRTRERIRFEAYEAVPELMFQTAGFIPSRTAGPELWSLLLLAREEAAYFTLREKRQHARPRPTHVRPRIGTTIPVPRHPAYPSGHAAQIHTLARVLATLNPDCEEAYRLYAAGVSLRREIAGVHFPSDSRAGVLLATTIVPLIMGDPSLQERVAVARGTLEDFVSETGCPTLEIVR